MAARVRRKKAQPAPPRRRRENSPTFIALGFLSLSGHVIAPNGAVTVNGGTITGSVIADGLTLQGNGALVDVVE